MRCDLNLQKIQNELTNVYQVTRLGSTVLAISMYPD